MSITHDSVAARAVVLLLMCSLGCGGNGTPTEPSSGSRANPSTGSGNVPLPGNEALTGRVTDRITSAPISGAIVVFSQPHPSPRATTDGSGNYSLSGLPVPGGGALVWAMAEGYEEDIQYYRAASQSFRLYPIESIRAGGSAVVTVRPDDSLCWNNMQEPGYGVDLVCRLVRIQPSTGVLTVEAVPIDGGSGLPLVVMVKGGDRVLEERLGNPVSVAVTPEATTAIAFVSIGAGSPGRSFKLATSIAPR